MDWADVVNGALERADDVTFKVSVVFLMAGAAVGVASAVHKIIAAKFAKQPTIMAGSTEALKVFLEELFDEMERRQNMRVQRVELKLDEVIRDGNERDVAIARIEVHMGLSPILERKERIQ